MEYTINGLKVPFSALYSKKQILDKLRDDGPDDSTLAYFRARYADKFGNELMWLFPITDGIHAGAFIVCCKEGFLYLPWDTRDSEICEILELDDAELLDEGALDAYLKDWKDFSERLSGALTDMLDIVKTKQ